MSASNPHILHREFRTKDGRNALLRPLRWEDLDGCLGFATELVEEHSQNIHHGTLLAKTPTRVEEMEWLGKTLVGIEKGTIISAAAEVDGDFAGNSEVTRRSEEDYAFHGTLGIAVSKRYRGLGLGTEMMRALLEGSRAAGLKTIQLGALATNERAIILYERVGFTKVGIIPKKVQRRGTAIDEMVMSIEL